LEDAVLDAATGIEDGIEVSKEAVRQECVTHECQGLSMALSSGL
jgi:hypothetical protein